MTTSNKFLTIFGIFAILYFTWQVGRAYGQKEFNKQYRTRVNDAIGLSTECDLDDEPITSRHGLCFNGQSSEVLLNLIDDEDQAQVISAIVKNVK